MGIDRSCVLGLQIPFGALFTIEKTFASKCSCGFSFFPNTEEHPFCSMCGKKKEMTEQYKCLKTGKFFDDIENGQVIIEGFDITYNKEYYPEHVFILWDRIDCNCLNSRDIDISDLQAFKSRLINKGLWELGTFGMFVMF